MLEFLRHQTKPIMITLAVIIIIAFTFWGGSMKTGARGQQMASADDTAFTLYGQEYSYAEKNRLERFFELARSLQMFDFLQGLMSASRKFQIEGDRIPLDVTVNHLVLRKELERAGIRASNAEAQAEFKKLPAFRNRTTGEFDPSVVEMFQKNLGSYGMNENDVLDLMRDAIGLRKLQKLVSGNYVESKKVVDQFYTATYQTIKSASITFPLETYKKAAQVSADDIKKYYDSKKEEFKTSEKRAVSYVLIKKPDLDAKPEEKKDDKKDAAKKDEKKEEPKPLSEDERRKKLNDYSTLVNDFSTASIKSGAKFEDVAKEFKQEVKTLPVFSRDAAPEAIKDEFTLLGDIFSNDPKTHPISEPVEAKDGSYYFFQVTKVEETRQQELKEVEAKIKETLVEQKGQELMTKAAGDARKAIEEAVKAGKKFEDAVKEQKLEATPIAEFSPAEPLKELPNGREIAGRTEKTAAGKFTEALTVDKGLMIVYVISKELRKREDSAKLREDLAGNYGEYSQSTIFRAWFDRRRDEAKIDATPILQRVSNKRG